MQFVFRPRFLCLNYTRERNSLKQHKGLFRMKFGGALHVFSTVAVVGFASACYTLLGLSIGDTLNTLNKLESTLMASEERTRDELLEAIGDSKKELREEILKAKKEIMVSHHPSNKTTTEPHWSTTTLYTLLQNTPAYRKSNSKKN